MRFNIRKNLYLKIFSLLLALACWFVISSEEEHVKDIAVPVEYVNLPPALEISGQPIDTVAVRLRAPEPILRTITEDRLAARIDLARAILGEQHIQLTAKMFRVPGGATVARITPDLLPLKIEKRVRRDVPVVADFAGRPPRGYQMVGHEIDPAEVTIEGPASEVARVERATTGTIILGGESADLEIEVTPIPDAAPDSRVRVVSPRGPVRVRVTIKPKGGGRSSGLVPPSTRRGA